MTTAEIPISGPGISDYSNEMLSAEDAAALLAEDAQYAREAQAAAEQQDALNTLASFEAKIFHPDEPRDPATGRWVHATDALLAPGDLIVPAAARDHRSQWSHVSGYSPDLVYLKDTEHPAYDGADYGSHLYEVEPVGDVGPDPEVEAAKAHPPEEDWRESDLLGSAANVTASAAKVKRHAVEQCTDEACRRAARDTKAFHPDEPRDLAGRWTRTGGAGDLLRRGVRSGGFTFNVQTGQHETHGYVVAVAGHGNPPIPRAEFRQEHIEAYLAEKMPVLLANPHLRLGGWYDEKHDEMVLDLVEVYDDRDTAVRLGQERDEQAIWHLDSNTPISTGGTGGRKDDHGGLQQALRAGEAARELSRPPGGRAQGLGEGLLRRDDEVGLKFDPAERRGPDGRWARVDALWGKGDLNRLFPDGALSTQIPFPSMGMRKDRKNYDSDLIARTIATHHETQDVDPRTLSASQPGLTRQGVAHYLNGDAEVTGRLFADHHSRLNAIPTIYAREDGTNIIISGHHRAAAALLQGVPLRARVIRGPWPSR